MSVAESTGTGLCSKEHEDISEKCSVRPVSYENRIILRAIILNTHGSREAPKTHGLTYVLLAQNFGVIRRKILVKFCTLKNGF